MGGQERVALDLARGFYARNYRVTILSLTHGGALGHFFDRIPIISVERRTGIDSGLPWRLSRIFRDLHVDIVHTHNPAALTYGVPAARIARVRRVIHTKHGANPPRSRSELTMRRALLRMCDAYVAVSKPTADIARRLDRAPERLLHVIHNGVDTGSYAHDALQRLRIRQELGISPEACVIGTVGRLAAEKNQRLLVSAVAPFLSSDIQLVIVGAGPERRAIEESIPFAVRKFVHLPGAREDIPALLSSFDLFVLSSSTEGLPLVIPEAMAAGLPVVATSVGGLPTVIRDRRTGILVSPEDQAALSGAVAELVHRPDMRYQFGISAIQDARSRFDSTRMLDDYEALYL